MDETDRRPHVVIIGGGFGGLTAAQSLEGDDVRITLIDRTNHHLFQPLLYQVATSGLSPADIASPIRAVLHQQRNVRVLLADVTRVDLAAREVHLAAAGHLTDETVRYDYLIVAAGAETNYFGHDEWERYAPGLKSLDDALEIRRRVLVAFEAAEHEVDPARSERLTTFVVIGGGPTGAEMAGAIAELSRFVLARDFRTVDPTRARTVLVEAGPRVLASFSPELSVKAVEQLMELGVEVRTGKAVSCVDERGVHLGDELIPSATVVWGAGVRAAPLSRTLGAPLDRSGRVLVEKDCSIPGHPEAFCIGDMAAFLHTADKSALPGVSPVAMQQARFVARTIRDESRGMVLPRGTFAYRDKGSMATLGRSRAIAVAKGLELSGFAAWMAWLTVHLWFLIGFRNRVAVMLSWLWSYVTYGRGSRLITGHRMHPGAPLDESSDVRPPAHAHPAAQAGAVAAPGKAMNRPGVGAGKVAAG